MKPHFLMDLWLVLDSLMFANTWVHGTALLSEDNDTVSVLPLATDFPISFKKPIFSSFLTPGTKVSGREGG